MTNNEIHFNLLDEPWIRVLRSDGSIAECGVLEILQRAHELAEVYDPAPIVECGILRFLVAFVSDALGITTTNDIRQLLRSRQFDMGKINAYAGPLHDRFDLFDPDRPFFQVPLNMESKLSTPIATSDTKKAKAKKIKLKSVAVLFQYIPSGTNVVHFFHTLQDEHAASPASCARALCTLPPFAPSGGSGLSPSINRSPPIYALIQGKNLFDTIVLNCCGVPMPMNTGSKPVAWKLDAPVIAEKMRDASTLQGLTWQPRKVHLIPGEGGKCSLTGLESNVLVRQVLFDAAWSAKEIKSWSDPHVSYGKESVKSKKRYAIKLKRERAIWRDTGPLMILTEEVYNKLTERPAVVRQFVTLAEREIIDPDETMKINVYGIRTKQAEFIQWQKESLQLPFKLVIDDWRGVLVQESLDAAEDVARSLGSALRSAYPRKGKGNKKAFGKSILHAQLQYWQALEPRFTKDLVMQVAIMVANTTDAADAVKEAWRLTLREVSIPVLIAALDSLGRDADALGRQVLAQQRFFKNASKQLFAQAPRARKKPPEPASKLKTAAHQSRSRKSEVIPL